MLVLVLLLLTLLKVSLVVAYNEVRVLFRARQAHSQSWARLDSLSGISGEESASKLIQALVRV